jgi:hypothetical protein
MNIPLIDAVNYLKGLLLLIRKDRKVTDGEIRLMKRIGNALGFERAFCANAIQEILENQYIVDLPPEFSTKKLAVRFIQDGLALACSDDEVHPAEEAWLRSTAEKNGLGLAWFRHMLASTPHRNRFRCRLEAERLIVAYS